MISIIYGAYLEDQRTPWNAISTGALPPIGYTLIAEDSSGQTERLTFDFTYNLHTISWKGRPYDPLDQEVFFPNYGFHNETISLPWSSINSDYSDFGRTPEHTNIETFNLEGLDIEAELRTRSINNNGYDQNLPFLILRKTSRDRIAPTRKEVRVTITDYDGITVSFYLDIYISDPNPSTSPRDLPDSSPRFNSSVESQEWRMGEYVSLPLPKASGGNGKLNYVLVEPFGWSYRAFREIEGNLVGKVDPQDVTTSSGTFQYQVTDSDGDSDILEIPVNIVSSELEISHDLSDTVFRAQEELLFVELPTPIGGDGRYTFQLTPSLPNGLLIMDFDQLDPNMLPDGYHNYRYSDGLQDQEGYAIIGVTEQPFKTTEYTYTVSDGSGNTISSSFNLEAVQGNILGKIEDNTVTNLPTDTSRELDPSEPHIHINFKNPSLSTPEPDENGTGSNTLNFKGYERHATYLFQPNQLAYRNLPIATGGIGETTYSLFSIHQHNFEIFKGNDGSLILYGLFQNNRNDTYFKITAEDSTGQEANYTFNAKATKPYYEYYNTITSGGRSSLSSTDVQVSWDTNQYEYFVTSSRLSQKHKLRLHPSFDINIDVQGDTGYFEKLVFPEIVFDPPLEMLSTVIEMDQFNGSHSLYLVFDVDPNMSCIGRKEVVATLIDPIYGETEGVTIGLNFVDPPTTSSSDDSTPQFTDTVLPQTLGVGELMNLPLPKAEGGNGELTYTLEEPENWENRLDLLSWLAARDGAQAQKSLAGLLSDNETYFTDRYGNLYGSTMQPLPPGTFRWTVTDQDGDQDILEIPVTIVPAETQEETATTTTPTPPQPTVEIAAQAAQADQTSPTPTTSPPNISVTSNQPHYKATATEPAPKGATTTTNPNSTIPPTTEPEPPPPHASTTQAIPTSSTTLPERAYLANEQIQQFLPSDNSTRYTRVGEQVTNEPVASQPEEQATSGFTDITSSLHWNDIRQLAEMGISQGCNPPHNTNYCPDTPVTRAQLATFLTRALNLPPTNQNPFTDITENTHHNNINRIAAAGITQGCNPPTNTNYCPDTPVTRAEMATFLVRALNLPTTQTDKYQDDNTSIHQQNINTIAAAGITQGCNPPHNTNYCPDTPVTRAQLATFLTRALK